MPNPLISVIIPVFNGERFVAEAIESVLAQQIPDNELEILVVDDGSTDATAARATAFGGRVTYLYQPNRGAAAARNAGIARARGALLGLLDADDLYAPGMLAATRAALEADPAADLVVGLSQYLFLDGADDRGFRFPDATRQAFNLLPSAGLYRKAVFERVGGFDETLPFADDFDWFTRARERGVEMRVLNQVTQFYRHHGQNLTHQREKLKSLLLVMLKKSLDRRRASAAGLHLPPVSAFARVGEPVLSQPPAA